MNLPVIDRLDLRPAAIRESLRPRSNLPTEARTPMADLDDLRVRFNAAKLAGRRTADDTIYAYAFRSNEQAADIAVDVVGRWLDDSPADPHREQVEAVLDSLLNGIEHCRADLPAAHPVRMRLRDLMDMANAARNNVNRETPSDESESHV